MSEPFDHLLEKYARLVIRVGVNVQPGQEVVVNALPEQADVARALAEEAYRVGAVRVTIEYQDRHVQRSAVLHAPEESLGRTPLHRLEGVRAWRESRPAVITLTGNPSPDLMNGLASSPPPTGLTGPCSRSGWRGPSSGRQRLDGRRASA